MSKKISDKANQVLMVSFIILILMPSKEIMAFLLSLQLNESGRKGWNQSYTLEMKFI